MSSKSEESFSLLENVLMDDSQIQHSILVTSLESSIESYQKKKKWNNFFHFGEQHEQENKNKEVSWRNKLGNFLDSNPVRLITVTLVIVDIVFTVLELSSQVSCKAKDEKKEAVYHWLGVSILCLLMAKTATLVVALGGSFFRHIGHVVDGVVVIIALVLELVVKDKGGGFVMVVTLWRIVKVIESTLEISHEAMQDKLENIKKQFQELRNENKKLHELVSEKEAKAVALEEKKSMTEIIEN